MTLQQLTALIVGWAHDRNLIEGSTPLKQYLKLGEELGETYEAINAAQWARQQEEYEKAESGIRDGFGDMYVVLTILAAQLGSSILHPDAVASTTTTSAPGAMGLIGGALARGKDPMPHVWAMRIHIEEAAQEMFSNAINGCVEAAWNEIKDRKGRMVDGVFVKEGELQ
jgi:hypothetical protein